MARPKENKPHRSDTERERDRKLISAYYLRGKSQIEIAGLVGIDQSTVSRDLTYIRQQWRKDAIFDFNEAKGKELAEIDLLELTYWEAWERSLEEFKSKSLKQKGSKIEKNGEDEVTKITPVEAIQKSEERSGNPAFLQGVQWCIERRCKILGIDAPLKQQAFNFDMSQLTDEQLQRIANGEDPLAVIASAGHS